MRTLVLGALVALLMPLAAAPVSAQAPAKFAAAGTCRGGPGAENAGCGLKPYEKWEDGSPARPGGPPPGYQPSGYYFGGYNSFYGFGR